MTQQINRRTVTKGIAWSVPAIAIAGAAPAFATSHEPPPPVFDFANAWKNPGNACTTDCIPKQSYGVKVTVQNPGPDNFIIQFTSYAIGNSDNTTGVYAVSGTATCGAVASTCEDTCGSPYDTHAVCVPAGTTSLDLYVNSNSYGSSPNGKQWIGWRWISTSDCTVASEAVAGSETSPPNDVC